MNPVNPPAPIRVHATVWGANRACWRAGAADVIAGRWTGAEKFDVHSLGTQEAEAPYPFDVGHYTVLASGRGRGFQWIVHVAERPPALRELKFDQDPGCACVEGDTEGGSHL